MKLLAVFITLVCLVLVASASSDSGQGLVRIFAKQRSVARIDLGRPGISAGDQELFSYSLEDKPGHAIGYASFYCVSLGRMLSLGIRQCSAVLVMPRGRITVQGTRRTRDHYIMAVTGGTGLYEAVGGTLQGHLYGLRPRRERLLISLI